MQNPDIAAARRQLRTLANTPGEPVAGSIERYLPAAWVHAVANNGLLFLSAPDQRFAEMERAVNACIAELQQNLARIGERSSEGAPES